MKMLRNLKILCSYITAVIFLLTPTASVANNYVLHFKSSRAEVKVRLSVTPDTEVDGPPADGQELETIGGLPISGSTSPAQPPPEVTSGDGAEIQESETADGLPTARKSGSVEITPAPQEETEAFEELPLDQESGTPPSQEECGAVGGVPDSQSVTASSPVIVTLIDHINIHDGTESVSSIQPIANQPDTDDASTLNIRSLETGSATVSAYLQRGNTGKANLPVYVVPENELQNFVRTFASLVARKGSEMHTTQPFVRYGNLICNSDANSRWSYGRFATPFIFLAAAAGTASGFGIGMPGLAYGSIVTGGVFTPLSACLFSHTRFPNQFRVSFTFSTNGLTMTQEIHTLQQIAKLLRVSGGFNLASFTRQEESQTLTFNVRVSSSVNAERLTSLLETDNQKLTNPFSINVSANGKPTGEPTGGANGEPSGEPTGEPNGEPSGGSNSEPSGGSNSEPSGGSNGEPTGGSNGEPTGGSNGELNGKPTGEPASDPAHVLEPPSAPNP
ncbi:hypothetical protein [Endozoicomonas sp. 4G]|uniref:hypothetical protein n=1 Tax=Endozoicomonas sp. 4G TaxID=2872754 RepID=UPI00207870C5|nr:hypothetical protein [Endozoicomonas sp. 4G]